MLGEKKNLSTFCKNTLFKVICVGVGALETVGSRHPEDTKKVMLSLAWRDKLQIYIYKFRNVWSVVSPDQAMKHLIFPSVNFNKTRVSTHCSRVAGPGVYA